MYIRLKPVTPVVPCFFVNKLTMNSWHTFYTVYQMTVNGQMIIFVHVHVYCFTSWQSVCSWHLSHVYSYTSWLQTSKYIVFLYKSSWQQATITQCTPSIHNVICTWADFEHLCKYLICLIICRQSLHSFHKENTLSDIKL